MTPRRVLITGVSGFLGAGLAQALEAHGEIEHLAGIDLQAPSLPLHRTEFIRADLRSPDVRRTLAESQADTVVHAALTSDPASAGGRGARRELNVIGTMHLLAACQRSDRIEKLVLVSSTAVYGVDPTRPSILTEEWSATPHGKRGFSSEAAAAEAFASELGRRRPDVTVTVLRLAEIVGPQAKTPMTRFLSLPLVPSALGFDPRLQLLHEEDAVEVLRRAVLEDHPGTFNVAAEGVVYLSQAVRLAMRLRVSSPVPFTALASALRRTGLLDLPDDQVALILHGRVVDTRKLQEEFGFRPRFGTAQAVRDSAASHRSALARIRRVASLQRDVHRFLTGRGGPAGPAGELA